LIYRNCGVLDPFQSASGISLESLEKTVFPFASRRGLKYRWLRIGEGLVRFVEPDDVRVEFSLAAS
jgi:hypothetical protein